MPDLSRYIETLVDRLGGVATITRPARGFSQPIPGMTVQQGKVEAERTADFKAALAKDSDPLEGGALVSENVRRILVAPGDFEPEQGDTITFGSLTGVILTVDTVRPDGVGTAVHRVDVEI